MKYYLVNFLVFDNQHIVEDNTIALSIAMNNYDCTAAFKQQIRLCQGNISDSENIVIKTYKQISEDIYLLVHPFIKENKLPAQQDINSTHISYTFKSATYSK